ncbi:MAG TPA: hypothetical protein VL053_20225, partial [Arachidicoccus sp.]|nr:hypothetical protein [Arachidicoccus sp.]
LLAFCIIRLGYCLFCGPAGFLCKIPLMLGNLSFEFLDSLPKLLDAVVIPNLKLLIISDLLKI